MTELERSDIRPIGISQNDGETIVVCPTEAVSASLCLGLCELGISVGDGHMRKAGDSTDNLTGALLAAELLLLELL